MRVNPRRIILSFKGNRLQASLTAKDLGIHRSTVYRWIKKARNVYGCLSSAKLRRKSTRPKTAFKPVLSQEETGKILRLRKETNWTAEKITYHLQLKSHHRTVHRVLKTFHLVRKCGYHKRPLFQNTGHMNAKNTKTIGYLQMDVKYITPELSGLPWTCFEYAVIDIFSRYKEAVILNHLDQDGSILALLEMIPKLPFKPVFLQTDNGLEFQERFREHVNALGIKYHYIHKNTPNENALIERSFRTDEEEFFFTLKHQPQHYDELRQLFANYLHFYNFTRPHLGLELKTPYQVIHETVAKVVSD